MFSATHALGEHLSAHALFAKLEPHELVRLAESLPHEYPHDDLTHTVIRLRQPTRENLAEDLAHLKAGILDPASFINGYRRLAHPFELVQRAADGTVKAIRRGHNMRTNVGGQQEGKAIAGTAPTTNAQWLALSSTATTANIFPADTSITGEITTAGASGLSIPGGTTGGPRIQVSTVTPAAVGVSSSANTTNQYKDVLIGSFQWNGGSAQTVTGVGVYDQNGPGGNLWFEYAFSSLSMNPGDTLQITYTINY